jgi:hypothetical protein
VIFDIKNKWIDMCPDRVQIKNLAGRGDFWSKTQMDWICLQTEFK